MARRGRPPHPGPLTPAEDRVLEHVRQGLPNAEIAVRLGISVNTVRYHVSNLLGKAGADSREDLARWQPTEEGRGWRWGWLPLGLKPVAVGVVGVAAVAVVGVGAAFFFGLETAGDDTASPAVVATPAPEDLFSVLARPATAEESALGAVLGDCDQSLRLLGRSEGFEYYIATSDDGRVCYGFTDPTGNGAASGSDPSRLAMLGGWVSLGRASGEGHLAVFFPDGYDEAAGDLEWAELVGDNILIIESDTNFYSRGESHVFLPPNDGAKPPLLLRVPFEIP